MTDVAHPGAGPGSETSATPASSVTAQKQPNRGSGAAQEPPQETILRLMKAAEDFPPPAIFKRIRPGSAEEAAINSIDVPDWRTLKEPRLDSAGRRLSQEGEKLDGGLRQAVQKVTKVTKQTGAKTGRTYTSKYRGVHQTFPTRRWEAQFRRNGKPTSLGCFDFEEEAAKAYDKMIIWCELHQSSSMKGGITNFDIAMYEADIPMLQDIEQDDLVQMLRRDGRAQAGHQSGKQAAAGARAAGGNQHRDTHQSHSQEAGHRSDHSDDSRDTESDS